MMDVILIVYFALTLGVNCEEPQCSKFHYEAQMLDKMIRMEVKVEAMEKEILKTNQLVLGSLEALTTERQAVKAERESLEREYADLKKAITEDLKNTRDTLLVPTVAFKARGLADKSIETGQTVIFSTIMVNEGEAYDNVTGVFTVPVAGTYPFTIHLCLIHSNSFYYGIVYDNIVYTSGRFYDSQSSTCYTADAIVVLQPGQKVWVKSLSGSTTDVLHEYSSSSTNYWNTFSGVLIHK